MNVFYLTPQLLYNYEEECINYKNDTDEIIKIPRNKWLDYYKDYGWEELEYCWELELDATYAILDCGGNGDCFFNCLAEALNINKIYKNDLDTFYNVKELRNITSRMITEDNYETIIQYYRIELVDNEFEGDWCPNKINSLQELRNEIIKEGNNFWADHIIIQLLSSYFKINFLIINSSDIFDSLSIVSITDCNKYDNIIILYYESGCHYKLVGKYNRKQIQTVFSRIPNKIKSFIR